MNRISLAALITFALAAPSAQADEGLWTFDQAPLTALKSQYGFVPSAAWLEHLRLAAVNFSGASASFVSRQGLVLTNHHVGASCIQKLSTAKRDLFKDGYFAHSRDEELRCPDTELKVLQSISDVTRDVLAAAPASKTSEEANRARKGAIAEIEKRCEKETGLRCSVVSLYYGALYHLYRSRAWTDVRLVFAPEMDIAFFGGDPDNFVFPRFDLDIALFRVYENGKAVAPAQYLKVAPEGVRENDLVFAAGHPYSTDRLFTLAELKAQRDVDYPMQIASAARQQKLLHAFSAQSAESGRRAAHTLFGTENWLKAMRGEYKTLRDPAFIAAKEAEEARFRSLAKAKEEVSEPWTKIAAVTAKRVEKARETWAVGYGYRTLFDTAGKIVELVNERALPEDERLSDYRSAALPKLLLRLEADYPIYKDLEVVRQADYWQEARDLLGDSHPFVRQVLAGKTPQAAARDLFEASQIDRVAERRRLIEGGVAAVNASSDPLIVLARAVYPLRRQLAKFAEVEVETPGKRAAEELGRLRFAVFGPSVPPDATASLRLSYGAVKGYDADGVLTPWKTNFGGMYARRDAFDGEPPFALPEKWLKARGKLKPDTPFNLVTTVDIIGGNSGSPVVNRQGDLVGIIFDGNLESLGNRFGYTETSARSLAVDIRAIMEALDTVYGAKSLAEEMRGG